MSQIDGGKNAQARLQRDRSVGDPSLLSGPHAVPPVVQVRRRLQLRPPEQVAGA
jgi:hypothetical protein